MRNRTLWVLVGTLALANCQAESFRTSEVRCTQDDTNFYIDYKLEPSENAVSLWNGNSWVSRCAIADRCEIEFGPQELVVRTNDLVLGENVMRFFRHSKRYESIRADGEGTRGECSVIGAEETNASLY